MKLIKPGAAGDSGLVTRGQLSPDQNTGGISVSLSLSLSLVIIIGDK